MKPTFKPLPKKCARVANRDSRSFGYQCFNSGGHHATRSDRPILQALHAGKFTLVYSQSGIDELVEKLELPRIRVKYHLNKLRVDDFVAVLIGYGERAEPNRKVDVCRDPDDNQMIEAALAGQAEFVVTGDKDLLVLEEFETVRFITAPEFLLKLE